MLKCKKCMYLESSWCHLYSKPQIEVMKYCIENRYFQKKKNRDLVLEINLLHQEIDEMLEEKLKIIDSCLENAKQCPCYENKCGFSNEKIEKLELLYDKMNKVFKSEKKTIVH